MSVTTWLSVHDSVNLEKQQKNTTKLAYKLAYQSVVSLYNY